MYSFDNSNKCYEIEQNDSLNIKKMVNTLTYFDSTRRNFHFHCQGNEPQQQVIFITFYPRFLILKSSLFLRFEVCFSFL